MKTICFPSLIIPGTVPAIVDGRAETIQDLFTDQKVPRSARFSIPILVAGERVVAVPGGWIARGWQVEHETAACLRVTFAPAEGDT